jgi:hypothetical protein
MEYLNKLVKLEIWDSESVAINSVLQDMIGSKIINAGFIRDGAPYLREGGMTFDYEKNGVVTRIVFGYNELGEWIEFKGEIKEIDKE